MTKLLLLDHNIPFSIFKELKSRSIPCETAKDRGWDKIKNGALVSLASQHGFSCVVTRDRLFQHDATSALKKHPSMGMVLITLPQSGGRKFLEAFRNAWEAKPFEPIPGQVVQWPR